MRILLFCIPFLIGLLPSYLWAQADGLYLRSPTATPTSIVTLDGKTIFLGEPFTEKIDAVTLISQNNANTIYQLNLKQNKPYSTQASDNERELVLQGKCLRFNSSGGDPTQTDFSTDEISDLDFVTKAAAFFKIAPEPRHHPGHQFTARFVVDSNGYALTDPIAVKLELTNCGTQSFYIEQPSVPAGMLDVFSFTAFGYGPQWDSKDNAVPNQPYSCGAIDMMSQRVEIKPQGTRSIPVNLAQYLIFKKSGTYYIRGVYAFKILSQDKGYRTIWDEYAAADFSLKIK